MNNQVIEQVAVDKICERINLTDQLSAYIDKNDRTPSWDGFIYLYNSSKKTIDDFRGRIAAQVKGHETSKLDRDEISYSINIAHLHNYLEDGGVLLFVVYLNKNNDRTGFDYVPYCAELTPVNIMYILKGCRHGTKNVSVHLKKIPSKPDRFASLVLNCYENCKKQKSFAGADLPTVEELQKQEVLKSLEVSVSGYGSQNISLSAMMRVDTPLYARIKGLSIPLPIGNNGLMMNKTYSYTLDHNVTVAGKIYYNCYKVVGTAEEITIHIGNSFIIKFYDEKPGGTVRFKPSSTLREFVADAPFGIAFVEHRGFCIEDHPFDLTINGAEFAKIDIDTLKKNYAFYNRCVQVLDKLGCTDNIDITELTSSDRRNLQNLIDGILDCKPVNGLVHDLPPIAHMNVGKLKLVLGLTPCDEPGTYMIYNYLDLKEYEFSLQTDKKSIPVPIFVIFKKDDYLTVSNIPFSQLLPTFKDFEVSSYIYEVANDVMLRMLGAFDQATSERKNQLLETVQEFAEWLMTIADDVWDKRIALLNKLQIIKRIRNLHEKETEQLKTMIISSADRDDILFAAYLLLDNQEKAMDYFNRLSIESQQQLRNYPIFNLLKCENIPESHP
ncbi:MAG: hypothetical protein ACOX58_09530 [Christensenellales bacterium]